MIRMLQGDCRVTLAALESGSVQSCITSPPYYGLRDYGTPPLVWGGIEHEHEWTNDRWYAAQGNAASSAAAFTEAGPQNAKRLKDARWHDNNTCACGAWLGSLGLEPTPELFIEHLVECFREVKRVLRPDGTCWINLGDSYAGSGNGSNDHRASGSSLSKNDAKYQGQKPRSSRPLGAFHGDKKGTVDSSLGGNAVVGLAAKNLLMMPFRVAIALQQDGWLLRSVIPWLKRNCLSGGTSVYPGALNILTVCGWVLTQREWTS